MSDILKQKEVVARAVLENVPTTGATADQLVIKNLQVAYQNKDAEGAFDAMKTAMEVADAAPTDRAALEAARKGAYTPTEKNGAGQPTHSWEQVGREYRQGKAEAKAADLLDKGFDVLPNQDKAKVYHAVMTRLQQWPEAQNLLSGMSPKEKFDTIRRLVAKPEFKLKLQEVLNEQAGGEALGAEFKKLQEDLNTKDREMQAAERDRQNKVKEHADVSAVVLSYDAGQNKADLDSLTKDEQKNVATRDKGKAELDVLGDQIAVVEKARESARLLKDKAQFDEANVKVNELLDRQRKLAQDVAKAEGAIKRKADLEAEKKKANDDKIRLESEVVQADNKFQDAQTARFDAQANLDIGKLKLGSAEEKRVVSAEKAVSEAAKRFILAEVEEAEGKRQEMLGKMEKEAKDEADKKIKIELAERYVTVTNKFDKSAVKPNKEATRQDYELILRDSPDAFMEKFLGDAGLSPDQIKDKMSGAEGEALKTKLIGEVLARRVQTGRISNDEAQVIFQSDWGADAVKAAAGKKNALTDELKKLTEAGVIDGGALDDINKLLGGAGKSIDKKMIGKGFGLAALLMLLFSVGSPILAAGALASYAASGAMKG